jgi:hypothetical protein
VREDTAGTAVGRDVSMISAKGGRTERLQIMVDADERAAIDDFQFSSRMPSRAAAVRELLRRGLASAGRRNGDPAPSAPK